MTEKINQLTIFYNLFCNKRFITILSLKSTTIKDKISFKKSLENFGLKSKIIKNKLFIKSIDLYFPKYKNLIPLAQGFCIIVYPNLDNVKMNFQNIQSFFKFIKKREDCIFLGGLLDQKLINKSFFEDLLLLKDSKKIYINLCETLVNPQFNLTSFLNKNSLDLLTIIKKK